MKLENFSKSVSKCDEVLKLDSKNLKALLRKGKAQREMKELSSSVTTFKLAREFYPEDKTVAK